MKCRDYIFKLTSGQLEDAPLSLRLDARLHLLACSRCRAFTSNNKKLDRILTAYRQELQSPQAGDASEN